MTTREKPPPFPRSILRSKEKVRHLHADTLGLTGESLNLLPCEIADDDPYLLRVRALLNDGYAGVILSGPPGTGKTWYAAQIAAKLADRDPSRTRFIQFHPSYQYEDFVEGYVPDEAGGGFRLDEKHFLQMCKTARQASDKLCVLVIDELSRTDPARVFGEGLTYIEMTKRDTEFHLASGKSCSVPRNLVFLATMNPLDRGVDEVDAALERRFAKIQMDPDARILENFLVNNGMQTSLRERVLKFFVWLQRNANPYSQVGHAYFYEVRDEEHLRRLWDHQLRFFFQKAFRLDPEGLRSVADEWGRVVPPLPTDAHGGPEVADQAQTTPPAQTAESE